MPTHSTEPGDSALDRFRRKYATRGVNRLHRVEREVLGHEVGLNGYTTVAEADRLSEALADGPAASMLDVGCGYGWPGFHVAARLRCDLVATDVPVDALREARANVKRLRFRGRMSAVAADGVSLPFRDAVFGALVHADVLC